jgi:hypothetical protein
MHQRNVMEEDNEKWKVLCWSWCSCSYHSWYRWQKRMREWKLTGKLVVHGLGEVWVKRTMKYWPSTFYSFFFSFFFQIIFYSSTFYLCCLNFFLFYLFFVFKSIFYFFHPWKSQHRIRSRDCCFLLLYFHSLHIQKIYSWMRYIQIHYYNYY